MMGFRPYKNVPDEEETKSRFHGRINIFFFSAFLIFCIIIVRLAILQFVEGPELASQESGESKSTFRCSRSRAASSTPLARNLPTLQLRIPCISHS